MREYAKSVGIWKQYNDIVNKAFKQFPSGVESDVFLYWDGDGKGYVVKVTDYKALNEAATHMDFLDNHISLANCLSPQTKYELIGFTEHRGRFKFVVKQPYIEGFELEYFIQTAYDIIHEQKKQEKRIKDWMKKEYQADFSGGTSFENERYIFNDLHLKNVLEGNDGKFYLIDLIVSLKTDGKGGKAKYLPFRIVKNRNFLDG